jgi:hypothetical protein
MIKGIRSKRRKCVVLNILEMRGIDRDLAERALKHFANKRFTNLRSIVASIVRKVKQIEADRSKARVLVESGRGFVKMSLLSASGVVLSLIEVGRCVKK